MYLNVQIEIVINEQDRPRFLLIYHYSTDSTGLDSFTVPGKTDRISYAARESPCIFMNK